MNVNKMIQIALICRKIYKFYITKTVKAVLFIFRAKLKLLYVSISYHEIERVF